jgi:hypothetical protein
MKKFLSLLIAVLISASVVILKFPRNPFELNNQYYNFLNWLGAV